MKAKNLDFTYKTSGEMLNARERASVGGFGPPMDPMRELREVVDMEDHPCNRPPPGQLWLAPWELDNAVSCEPKATV